MELKGYLRTVIHEKVRPLLIKEICEQCESNNELHLHHVKLFSEMVDETLDDLNLDYKDTTLYSEKELKNITNIILGIHLKYEYITLCSSCHKEIHAEEWNEICVNDKHKRYYNTQKLQKKIKKETLIKEHITNTIIPYLFSILGKKLLKNDKEELIKVLDLKDERGRKIRGYNQLNNFLMKHDVNFIIMPKKSSMMFDGVKKNYRYWQVINIHEQQA